MGFPAFLLARFASRGISGGRGDGVEPLGTSIQGSLGRVRDGDGPWTEDGVHSQLWTGGAYSLRDLVPVAVELENSDTD